MASAKPKKKNPRLASGRKRVRQDVKLNAANTSLRSKYRTAVKNVEKAVLAGDKTKAAELFAKAQSIVDTVADKGIFHKNKAARDKSRLSAKVKNLALAPKRPPPDAIRHSPDRLSASPPFDRGALQQSEKPPSGGFFMPGRLRAVFHGRFVQDSLACGTRQASATCRSLSLAKFITKSQAMTFASRSSLLTTTHLMPLMTVGTHQGE